MPRKKPRFTQYVGRNNYTDYFVVSIVTEFNSLSNDLIHGSEKILYYIITHYKILNGKLYESESFIEMESDSLIQDITSSFRIGSKTCIILDNFAMFLNVSGFQEYLDKSLYKVSVFDINNYEEIESEKEKISVSFFAASGPPNYIQIESTSFNRRINIIDIANFINGSGKTLDRLFFDCDEFHEFRESLKGSSNSEHYEKHWQYNYLFKEIKSVFKSLSIDSIPNTPASGCMKYFRTLADSELIEPHNDLTLADFELKSYSFGRVDVPYIGEYYGKCHLLDIQSMYPVVCTSELLPYKMVQHGTDISIEEINDKLGENKWIIRAVVETDEPAYLQYDSGFHRFPTGKFITTLSGREVDYAITLGHVKEIIYAAEYDTCLLLQEFATKLINMRYKYRLESNKFAESIMKTIINSIWGKWASPGNNWEYVSTEWTEQLYDCYTKIDTLTGKEEFYRVVNGDVFRMKRLLLSDNCFPAISATIAGIGRSWIYYLIQTMGIDNLLYSCVDGMIIKDTGLGKLVKYIDSSIEGFGYLKISESDEKCKILGYGNYRIGSKKVMIGYNPAERKIYNGWHNRSDNPLGKIDHNIKEVLTSLVYPSQDNPDNETLEFTGVFGQYLGFPVCYNDYGSHKIDYYFLDQLYLNFE